MLAGRRLLESLIVYCKIEVNATIKEIKKSEEQQEADEYKNLNAVDMAKELSANKQLIKLTTGGENGESSGSDSEPSADNLDEEEMEKIVPVEKKKVKPVPKTPPPAKKVEPIKPHSPLLAKQRPVVKEITKSPTKKA